MNSHKSADSRRRAKALTACSRPTTRSAEPGRDFTDLPSVSLECSHCGTEIEFITRICPMCGASLTRQRSGIVSLLADSTFDEDSADELDCPLCGDRVLLIDGTCPSCGEAVSSAGSEKVDPIIHMDDVVYLHLDVPLGELSYLQGLGKRQRFEQMSFRIDVTDADHICKAKDVLRV